MAHEASLCWICGGHTDQAVAYWARACAGAGTPVDKMQAVVEKAVVLGLAPGVSASASADAGAAKPTDSLSELVTAYAALLAANGRMAMALDYLEHVPTGDASPPVVVLKDRIAHSGALNGAAHPPHFPYERTDLMPSAAAHAKVRTYVRAGGGARCMPRAAPMTAATPVVVCVCVGVCCGS